MASNTSKTMIAALQVSLDGFIEGPHGERDWADSWASAIELISDVDTFVLGARMYSGYGEYWEAIYADPERVPPFQERVPSKSEIAYARLAAKTPHIVLSKTLKIVSWPAAQIIRDVAELRTLKAQPGRNIYVVGGATLVASLLNENLIDELQDYNQQMGWRFPWVSSLGSDFSCDFGVAFTEEQRRNGADHNFRLVDKPEPQKEGLSVFALQDGAVHHTYSTCARWRRGLDGDLLVPRPRPVGQERGHARVPPGVVAPPQGVRQALRWVCSTQPVDSPQGLVKLRTVDEPTCHVTVR